MSPKPTQPEDLNLNQMEDCDLKEYVPSLEMKLTDGVTKNGGITNLKPPRGKTAKEIVTVLN